MNTRREGLVLLALVGMDLSWLYGWASLSMLALFSQPFPSVAAISLAGAAAGLLPFLQNRGWRIYQIIGMHALCLFLACVGVVSGYEQTGGLLLGVILFWCCVFWIIGARLAWQKRTPGAMSNHFDFGVIALVLLHLVEMLLETEGGIVSAGPLMPRTLFAFFAFSVTGFCLVRGAFGEKSGFIAGFRGLGVVLSFVAFLVLLGGGALALFLPYLAGAAQTGMSVLTMIAAPVGGFLFRIAVFLYEHTKVTSGPAAVGPAQEAPMPVFDIQQPEGWLFLLMQGMIYLIACLGILFLLVLCGFMLRQLGWWLAKRTGTALPGPSPWQLFYELMHRIFVAFKTLVRKVRGAGNWTASPVQLYLALVSWGGLSGLALAHSETPQEYGQRLGERFPAVRKELQTIILAHSEIIYGEKVDHAGLLKQAWSASQRLRSPRHWPARLKSLLFR